MTDESAAPRLSRTEMQRVIRRAAELTASAGEADDVSADELLRIGADIGLPQQYLRQALFELPLQDGEGSRMARWLGRSFGPAYEVSTRVVSGEPQRTLARIEEHLVAREFLELRRRQPSAAWFEPAHDTLSAFSRAIGSLSRDYRLRRARRVAVMTQPLADAHTQVHVLLDFAEPRDAAARNGVLAGGILGMAGGAGAFLAVGAVTAELFGLPAAWLAGGAAGFTSVAAGAAAGFSYARRGFRRRIAAARVDVEGMLDRLQTGAPLAPPAGAWIRRVRSRFLPAHS